MDFGQIQNPEQLDRIQFSLPALNSAEEQQQLERLRLAASRLSSSESQTTKIYVGAPIWNEPRWVGQLYPEKTPSKYFLQHYAKKLSTVELNSTFYALPPIETFRGWKEKVPSHFRFCPKFPKAFSHEFLQNSLQENQTIISNFAEHTQVLGETLGTCFLQLPQGVEYRNQSQLKEMFSLIPPSLNTVVEFRHESFFESQRLKPEIIDLLAHYRLGTVICDTPLYRDLAHVSLSATRVMIRFLGCELHPSDYSRIDDWATRIATWAEAGIREVYFLIHEPDNVQSVHLIAYCIERLNQELSSKLGHSSSLLSPIELETKRQLNLF